MQRQLDFRIQPQPDETTCGPTCLHAVYRYFERERPLDEVIEETHALEGGGTLAVMLGCHALRQGFKATIYTYNLQIFDPSWFSTAGVDLADRLRKQAACKNDPKLQAATPAYLDYLANGGRMRFEDLTNALIRRYLNRGIPVLTGLNATYLYRTQRELDDAALTYDDLRGESAGHFVVLCGYDKKRRTVRVADPLLPNPMAAHQVYDVDIRRVLSAILLGIVTYDANLLILEPRNPPYPQ